MPVLRILSKADPVVPFCTVDPVSAPSRCYCMMSALTACVGQNLFAHFDQVIVQSLNGHTDAFTDPECVSKTKSWIEKHSS